MEARFCLGLQYIPRALCYLGALLFIAGFIKPLFCGWMSPGFMILVSTCRHYRLRMIRPGWKHCSNLNWYVPKQMLSFLQCWQLALLGFLGASWDMHKQKWICMNYVLIMSPRKELFWSDCEFSVLVICKLRVVDFPVVCKLCHRNLGMTCFSWTRLIWKWPSLCAVGWSMPWVHRRSL